MWGRGGTAIRQRFFKPTARMMLSVQATVFIWIITRVRTHHCVEDEKNNQHKGGGMAAAHIESGRQNGCLKNCKVKSLANCKARNTRKHGQHAKATTDLGTFVPEWMIKTPNYLNNKKKEEEERFHQGAKHQKLHYLAVAGCFGCVHTWMSACFELMETHRSIGTVSQHSASEKKTEEK